MKIKIMYSIICIKIHLQRQEQETEFFECSVTKKYENPRNPFFLIIYQYAKERIIVDIYVSFVR